MTSIRNLLATFLTLFLKSNEAPSSTLHPISIPQDNSSVFHCFSDTGNIITKRTKTNLVSNLELIGPKRNLLGCPSLLLGIFLRTNAADGSRKFIAKVKYRQMLSAGIMERQKRKVQIHCEGEYSIPIGTVAGLQCRVEIVDEKVRVPKP